MAVSATNLIQGAADIYVGAFGVTEPADTALNTTPGAGWTDLGGTDGGVKLTVEQKYSELAVDQIVDRLARRLVSRDIMVETSLAEPTLENLKVVLNAGTITTGTGTKAFEPAYASSATQPAYQAALFDGYAPGGFRRRVIVRKVLSTDKASLAYDKDKQTFVPVTFAAHYVTASIAPMKIVDGTA